MAACNMSCSFASRTVPGTSSRLHTAGTTSSGWMRSWNTGWPGGGVRTGDTPAPYADRAWDSR
jgi:hypothetical protein